MNSYSNTPSKKARLSCLFYETLTVLALAIVGLIIPHTIISAFIGTVATGKTLLGHLFLMLLLYFAWQWLHGGQTLAMKTWKIRLISIDKNPIRPAQALLRYALAWPGTLLLGIGFLWAIVDQDGLYLHDRIAGTRLENV